MKDSAAFLKLARTLFFSKHRYISLWMDATREVFVINAPPSSVYISTALNGNRSVLPGPCLVDRRRDATIHTLIHSSTKLAFAASA